MKSFEDALDDLFIAISEGDDAARHEAHKAILAASDRPFATLAKMEGFQPPVCPCDSEGEHWAYEPDLESLTCFACPHRATCDYVDDPYNTNGDCLALK